MSEESTTRIRPRRRAIARRFALLGVIGTAALAVGACGEDDETGTETTDEVSAGTCQTVEDPAPKSVDIPAPKAKEPAASAVIFDTSCGSFTVTLDTKRAPKTAASFEYMAEEGVFDGTPFHRIIPGFVVQGGDPQGTGQGGPGFSVTEKPPGDLVYERGIVAMAKTEAEPSGTSGSQFFVVTAPADAGLPPDYALVGEVTEGFDVVQAIEGQGIPGDPAGTPQMPVVINSATPEG